MKLPLVHIFFRVPFISLCKALYLRFVTVFHIKVSLNVENVLGGMRCDY